MRRENDWNVKLNWGKTLQANKTSKMKFFQGLIAMNRLSSYWCKKIYREKSSCSAFTPRRNVRGIFLVGKFNFYNGTRKKIHECFWKGSQLLKLIFFIFIFFTDRITVFASLSLHQLLEILCGLNEMVLICTMTLPPLKTLMFQKMISRLQFYANKKCLHSSCHPSYPFPPWFWILWLSTSACKSFTRNDDVKFV